MKKYFIKSFLLLSAALMMCSCDDYKDQYSVPGYNTFPDREEEVEIQANDPLIHYVGRTSVLGKEVGFDWVGTYFEFDVTSDYVAIDVEHSGNGTGGFKGSYLNIFIDGVLERTVFIDKTQTVLLEKLGKQKRTIKVQKRTEGRYGKLTIKKLRLAYKGELHKTVSTRQHLIEFVGDSYTCGYGVEGLSKTEAFKLETENSNLTYACIIARAFNTDYSLIANSGFGIVRNTGSATATSPLTMRDYFLRAYNMETTEWDFAAYKPDMVVIFLGQNDFSGSGDKPNEKQFSEAYNTLIDHIRAKYGTETKIMCYAPRFGEPATGFVSRIVEARSAEDSNVFYGGSLAGVVTDDKDLGSISHPNYNGQKKMAKVMIPEIEKVMKWTANLEELD